jgi:hypothetical protein
VLDDRVAGQSEDVDLRLGEIEITDEEREAFPESSLPDLVAALQRVRRLAHGYSVITSAEAIVRLFGDMASASRAALEEPGLNDEITWFLLQRFLDDRVSELVHCYRTDLGLGLPSGAPKGWPMAERGTARLAGGVRAHLRTHIPKKKAHGSPDPGR